jgi:hypothetical protein
VVVGLRSWGCATFRHRIRPHGWWLASAPTSPIAFYLSSFHLVINDLCKLVRNTYYPIFMTIIEDELIITREGWEAVQVFCTGCLLPACCRSAHRGACCLLIRLVADGVRLCMLLPCSIVFGSCPLPCPHHPIYMYACLDWKQKFSLVKCWFSVNC